MPDYRTITIGARTQFVVKVSPEDYDWLMQWKWRYARSHGPWSGLIYARRSERAPDGGNVTILMHREIIIKRMGIARPSDNHFVDHDNGDSLDNRRFIRRRQQLQWLTPKENMAKRRTQANVYAAPLSPEAMMAEIPF